MSLPPSPLIQAIRANRPSEVERLLQEGANPNGPLEDRAYGQWSSPPERLPILCAAGLGRLECLRVLARFGADLDAALDPSLEADGDSGSRRAAFVALARDQIQCLRELERLGADMGIRDGQGRSLFLHAAARGAVHCLRFLAQIGDDVEQTDPMGDNAPSLAIDHGKPAALRALLEMGCPLSALDGSSLVVRAALAGQGECLYVLEYFGVDFLVQTPDGAELVDVCSGHVRHIVKALTERCEIRISLRQDHQGPLAPRAKPGLRM